MPTNACSIAACSSYCKLGLARSPALRAAASVSLRYRDILTWAIYNNLFVFWLLPSFGQGPFVAEGGPGVGCHPSRIRGYLNLPLPERRVIIQATLCSSARRIPSYTGEISALKASHDGNADARYYFRSQMPRMESAGCAVSRVHLISGRPTKTDELNVTYLLQYKNFRPRLNPRYSPHLIAESPSA